MEWITPLLILFKFNMLIQLVRAYKVEYMLREAYLRIIKLTQYCH